MCSSDLVGSGHHETEIARCEMYAPLLVTNYDQIGPTFDDANQHPLVLVGQLKKANDSLALNARVTNEKTADFNPYMVTAAASGFDHLLVCNAHLLQNPLPSELSVAARTEHFTLLQVRH